MGEGRITLCWDGEDEEEKMDEDNQNLTGPGMKMSVDIWFTLCIYDMYDD